MRIDKSIPVSAAFLHQAVSIPGIMNTEKSLNPTRLPGIKMFCMSQGLVIIYKKKCAIVPSANVAAMVLENFEEEDDSPVTEKVKK